MTKYVALLPILLLAIGCQSYQDGLAAVCNAPSTCGAKCAEAAPELRLRVLSEHVEDTVVNGEAKELYESLAAIGPAERAIKLKQEAQKVGLPGCPLADMFAAR